MSITPRTEVSMKVVSQKGLCQVDHKVGDEWVMKARDLRCPPMCMFAFDSVDGAINLLMYGGS